MPGRWFLLFAALAASDADGNAFTEHVITALADGALEVFAIDVDGDGDTDALSANWNDNTVAWYENDGSQSFSERVISTLAVDGVRGVFAIDVDGDGDVDALSTLQNEDTVAWYENDGAQSFTERIISDTADGALSPFAIDVDGDGDVDPLSASFNDDTVAWYENDGSQSFTKRIITDSANYVYSVFAIDVDGDGNVDVLSASRSDNTVAWYENDGSESFHKHVITYWATRACSVFAIDVDGDGDVDALSASSFFDGAVSDNTVAWYENDGSESFTKRVITTLADGAYSVFAIDVDGDGDSFTQRVITDSADEVWSVYAIDVDGDGDVDALSASEQDDTVAWYESLMTPAPTMTPATKEPTVAPTPSPNRDDDDDDDDEAALAFTALLAVVLLAVCLFGCGAGFFFFYARAKSAGNEKEASSQELPDLFKHSSKVTSKRVVEPLRCVSVCRVVKADAAGVFAVGDALEVAGAGAALAKALKRGAHLLARDRRANDATASRPSTTAASLEWMKPPDELPYATETAGIGGSIKAACGDFVVEELLDGEPDGVVHRGAYHHWLLLRRENLTTESCQRLLARAFGLDDFRDVGCCGRKDKVARATQWFSVPCYSPTLERVVDDAASLVPAPLEVLRAERCSRKLRRNGHAGNRFEVTVTDVKDVAAALETCARTAKALDTLGVPNYFGAQRFGNGCRTAARGFRLLAALGAARGPERRRLKKRLANGFAESFAVAAFNAAVFNAYVGERLRDGTFAAFLEGDVCTRRNLAPGRRPAADDAFDAAALDADFAAGRCSYTGPLLGRALRSPSGHRGAHEDRVLARCGVARETVALVAEGSRRAARLPAPGLSLAATPRGLVLAFAAAAATRPALGRGFSA
ncbi:hypothetical protein JL720_2938 [Aureococcus anophagefferens]|nr:hypothetical protein JL720_2938 [Aureococcus anophagefferens]